MHYFQSLPLENQLDDESKLNCEGPITYEECEKALSKMKKKVSRPGWYYN